MGLESENFNLKSQVDKKKRDFKQSH